MPRTLRVRSYRQRKAGACGKYSHATYMAGPTTGLPLQRSLLVMRFYFSGLAVAVFVPLRHRPERNDRND